MATRLKPSAARTRQASIRRSRQGAKLEAKTVAKRKKEANVVVKKVKAVATKAKERVVGQKKAVEISRQRDKAVNNIIKQINDPSVSDKAYSQKISATNRMIDRLNKVATSRRESAMGIKRKSIKAGSPESIKRAKARTKHRRAVRADQKKFAGVE